MSISVKFTALATLTLSPSTALAEAQIMPDYQDYEVIIYDADTVDALNAKPAWPVDISAQYHEIIAGVPIIEDPASCGKNKLEIGVTVENVASDKGTIVADLHDDIKENFLVWDKVVLRVRAPAKAGETRFCMPLTRPGEYAVAVYHDKNGNKEFDKNFLGIPKEHFGMSSNPKFGMRSPEYEETAFDVPEGGIDIKITLRKSSDIL